MKVKYLLTALSAFIIISADITSLSASIITPGQSAAPDVFTTSASSSGYTLLASTGLQNVDPVTGSSFDASYTEYVYRDANNLSCPTCLDFLFSVSNAGPGIIERLSTADFDSFITDVGYNTSGITGGPSAVPAGIIPLTVDRSSSGGVTARTESVLYSFAAIVDCGNPKAVIQGSDGNFYGIASTDGQNTPMSGEPGALFKITPGGVETVLYVFGASSSDGAQPNSLIQGSDGNFYGTTLAGGANRGGTVFKVTPDGVETVLYAFGASSSDGIGPNSLIQGSDGNFYGTTGGGGANTENGNLGDGTIFKVTPGGVETVLYSFGASSSDGVGPVGLIQGSDGYFYGTTSEGGNGVGTVFRF